MAKSSHHVAGAAHPDPYDVVVSSLEAAGCQVRNGSARCPAHDDRSPSLSVSHGDKGVLLHCHAGCDTAGVLRALDLEPRDLFYDNGTNGHTVDERPVLVGRWPYVDEDGTVLYEVLKWRPKDFRPRQPNGTWGYGDRRVLYQLPAVLRAVAAGHLVWLCEGEKDADAVQAVLPEGEVATTNPGGANGWRAEYTATLAGHTVMLVADRDAAGYARARKVTADLDAAGCHVFPVQPPEGAGKDVADMLGAGYTLGQLTALTPCSISSQSSQSPQNGNSEHSEDSEQWELPVPLGRAVELPTFPVDAMPAHAAAFIEATAEATQTPADLVGCVVLAAEAAAMCGRAHVRVREGHVEPTQLYVCPVMAPGERKSPVFAAATAPLVDAERELVEATVPEIRKASTERELADGRAQAAKQQAIKAKATERDTADKAALDAAQEAAEIVVPSVPRLISDDATPEALGSLLADQGGRMAVFSDEGGGLFDIMAGRYSSSGKANLDIYLKGHTGSPHRVDRKGRPPEHIPNPAVSLALTMQPAVLEDIGRNATMRGRGLFGRFLFAVPRSLVGARRVGAPPVPAHVRNGYAARLGALVKDMWERAEPAVLDLSPEALTVFEEFETDLEPRLVDDLDDIRDWATKLAGQVARIAGVLHLAAGRAGTGPVTASTMEAAVELGDYFLKHAQAAFDVMGASEAVRDARRIGEWIPSQGDSFTKRDAHQKFRASMTVDQVGAALDVLEAHHWIARQPPPERKGPGRPGAPRYDINPRLRE